MKRQDIAQGTVERRWHAYYLAELDDSSEGVSEVTGPGSHGHNIRGRPPGPSSVRCDWTSGFVLTVSARRQSKGPTASAGFKK